MNNAQIISGYEFRVEDGVIARNSGFSNHLNPLKILVDIFVPFLHSDDVIY
jgi:hypothetical protein